MKKLITEIRACQVCLPDLVHGVNPVFSVHQNNQIAIIGHAPGRKVHESSIPWDDKSGERLRSWLGVDNELFYKSDLFAILPMSFCYPGTGKTGDLAPRKECAPLWHRSVLKNLTSLKLTLLIGNYSQSYYLGKLKKKSLTETVKNYNSYLPEFLPLPHPSPRNNIWLKKNPWFELEVIPFLRSQVKEYL